MLGKRRKLIHVPAGLARTGARLTERLPGAPLSVDQVTMIEGADNVVSNSDAVDTFRSRSSRSTSRSAAPPRTASKQRAPLGAPQSVTSWDFVEALPAD